MAELRTRQAPDMWWPTHAPPLRTIGRAAGIIALAALPVAAVWWFIDGATARSVYRGMTFMIVAVTHIALSRQLIIGFLVGVGALVGTLAADHLWLLMVAVVVACLAQAFFNQWSVGVAALLPAILTSYSLTPGGKPLHVTIAALVGVTIAIAAAALVKIRVPAVPADRVTAIRQAPALALGCLALILANRMVGLPHGSWAVLTFCLVFVPLFGETTARVKTRVLGTTIGAILAAAVAVAAPPSVCLALATVCGIFTVSYAIMPEYNLMYVAFLTPTIVLMYGASKFGTEVIGLAAERVGLTAVGGLLAIALTILVVRPFWRKQKEEATFD